MAGTRNGCFGQSGRCHAELQKPAPSGFPHTAASKAVRPAMAFVRPLCRSHDSFTPQDVQSSAAGSHHVPPACQPASQRTSESPPPAILRLQDRADGRSRRNSTAPPPPPWANVVRPRQSRTLRASPKAVPAHTKKRGTPSTPSMALLVPCMHRPCRVRGCYRIALGGPPVLLTAMDMRISRP